MGRSGSVVGSRLFGGSAFSGKAGLVGGSVLEEGIEWVGGSGSVGGSRLFVGPGFSGEAGLVGGSVLEEGIEKVGE